jgi:glycosyltransferase involved in cell wall biosynthesis
VRSIYDQTALKSGRVELEYIVCDGGSTDNTVEVAREESGGRAIVISERDGGMYDALAKGLRRASGDVVAYLNAGDMYHRTAFEVVADVFASGRVQWLTGLTVIFNPNGQVSSVHLPFRYRRRLIRCGLYGRKVLPFIQQECTFWSQKLHETLDWERLRSLRYAGDYYLWNRFSSVAELAIVQSFLGGFLIHAGQQSENMDAYRRELRAVASQPTPVDYLVAAVDRVLWYAPPRLKKVLNPALLLRCRWGSSQWD